MKINNVNRDKLCEVCVYSLFLLKSTQLNKLISQLLGVNYFLQLILFEVISSIKFKLIMLFLITTSQVLLGFPLFFFNHPLHGSNYSSIHMFNLIGIVQSHNHLDTFPLFCTAGHLIHIELVSYFKIDFSLIISN